MISTATRLFFKKTAPLCALALALTAVVGVARADDDDLRMADFLWPEGREHTAAVWAGGKISDADTEEAGPIQGPAEELCLRRSSAKEDDLQDTSSRTVVFFVARDRRTGFTFVVVPGFKVGEPGVNKAGVPFMRVVRIGHREQLRVYRALVKVLAKRGLAHAPVNFFLDRLGSSHKS